MTAASDSLAFISNVAMPTASTVGEGATYVAVGVTDGVSSAASILEENAVTMAGGFVEGASSLSSSTATTIGMVASALPSPAIPASFFDLLSDFSPTPDDEVAPELFQEGSYPGQPNIQV